LQIVDESLQLFPIMLDHSPNTQKTNPKIINKAMAHLANVKNKGIPTPKNES
jgi:hypothetical protein